MITENTYLTLKSRYERFQTWVDSIRSESGWASYTPEEIPDDIKPCHLSNEQIAEINEYEFFNFPPEKYFTYVLNTGSKDKLVGTFTGKPLGKIIYLGTKFKTGSFPCAERQYIKFVGINGFTYGGWFYCGSGDYCRVKKLKNIRQKPQVLKL